jgi:hypothetical protein
MPDLGKNVATNELKFKHLDAALDEALTESFPASDPIAINFSCAVASNSCRHVATTPKPKRRKTKSLSAYEAKNDMQGNKL